MKNLRKYLIVGLRELDAGKTTIAQALLLCLRERGIKASGFKPRQATPSGTTTTLSMKL